MTSLSQNNRQADKSSNQDRAPVGNDGRIQAAALKLAETECRRLAHSHYENFIVASWFLPSRLRQPFYNVYAFCRTADDLADESPSAELALQRLDHYQGQLDAAFAGRPAENLFLALAHTIDQFGLCQQPFDDLLSAFRQDQRKTRYATFSELADYCGRSANPVGRIVLQLAGCLNEKTAAHADQICTGLQLANFCQDIKRDHAMDRVYLPQDEMEQYGVTDEMINQSSTPAAVRQLLSFQCDRTEEYLTRGLSLAGHVPSWLANDVKLFAHGGLATMDSIRRIDFDVLRVRPTVSRRKQFALVFRAALRLL